MLLVYCKWQLWPYATGAMLVTRDKWPWQVTAVGDRQLTLVTDGKWKWHVSHAPESTFSILIYPVMIFWHGYVFQFTGTLWGDLPIIAVFPSKRTNNAKLVCFLCCQLEHAAEQAVKSQVIWDTMTLMWHHCVHDIPFLLLLRIWYLLLFGTDVNLTINSHGFLQYPPLCLVPLLGLTGCEKLVCRTHRMAFRHDVTWIKPAEPNTVIWFIDVKGNKWVYHICIILH